MSVSDLRRRIADSSLDEVVLEEMIRHGFWGRDQDVGTLPAEFFDRRRTLQTELSDILARDRRLSDPDKALAEVMKERMRKARLKRVETKRKAIEARNARGATYDAKRRRSVLSLGDVSSAPLNATEAQVERLTAQDLPVIHGAIALSEAMGIGLPELKFLAHDRKVARITHYQTFEIPKKTGGVRVISAPKPRLKWSQYWLLDNILGRVAPHDAAHGFRSGRSILTNAQPHVGQDLVVNMDLRDFFPSIIYPRVKGLFAAMGYAEADAALMALICTEAPRETIEIDGTTHHVATGPRATPQGAPTSPAIANLVARKLDRRLLGLARRFGFAYTRYADDMTFSGKVPGDGGLKAFHRAVQDIVADEGFALHPDKTRFMRRHQRQEVTGLTVNDKVAVPRTERRRFRAWLHQAEASGAPRRSFREGDPVSSGRGYASFLYMVGGHEGLALAERAWLLLGNNPGQSQHDIEDAKSFRTASAEARLPKPDWWQPADPAPFQPIPLPEFDRRDQITEHSQSAVPRSGRRLPQDEPARPSPGSSRRSQAAIRRADHLQDKRNKQDTSKGVKLFFSFLALFVQTLPFFGIPLTVFLIYRIWEPPGGYPGAQRFTSKLWVAIKILFRILLIDAAFLAVLAIILGSPG